MSYIDLPTNNRGKTKKTRKSNAKSREEVFEETFGHKNFEKSREEVFEETFGHKKFEKFSTPNNDILPVETTCANGLISTVHEAFANERDLVLSPDHIYTAILQAISIHVTENAEELRDSFVSHKEKKTIRVIHNGLHFGNNKSPWEEVFPKFDQGLRENLKDKSFATAALSPFTTSDETSGIVRTISLMEAMKEYFEYVVMTSCGITRIVLTGTTEDWKQLICNADKMCKVAKMEWWANELIPVLYHFLVLSKDPSKASVEFWSRIYKRNAAFMSGMSAGGTGWINVFFPYTVQHNLRKTCHDIEDQKTFADLLGTSEWWEKEDKEAKHFCSLQIDYADYPKGVSVAPFIWEYLLPGPHYGEHKMDFCGGFLTAVGISNVDKERDAVTPILAWMVAHSEQPEKWDFGNQ